MVPGSTFRYGSNFCKVTRKPRLSSKHPIDAAAMPLPKDETTPPVTKMYLAMTPPRKAWLEISRVELNSPRPKTTDSHGPGPQAYPLPETRIRCRRPESDSRFQVLAIVLNAQPVPADRQSSRGTPTKNRAGIRTALHAWHKAIDRTRHAHKESDSGKNKWRHSGDW